MHAARGVEGAGVESLLDAALQKVRRGDDEAQEEAAERAGEGDLGRPRPGRGNGSGGGRRG